MLFPFRRKQRKNRLFPNNTQANVRYLRSLVNSKRTDENSMFDDLAASFRNSFLNNSRNIQAQNIRGFTNEIFSSSEISGKNNGFVESFLGGITQKSLGGVLQENLGGSQRSNSIINISQSQLFSSILKQLNRAKRNL